VRILGTAATRDVVLGYQAFDHFVLGWGVSWVRGWALRAVKRWGVRKTSAVSAAVVIALIAGVWALQSGSPSQPAPRARAYAAFDACLLTGSSGLSAPEAASAWSGMQAGSAVTTAKVSYLAVVGPESADNVGSYLSTLIVRNCDVIFGVGAAETAAIADQAAHFPAKRFAVLGATASGPNVASVPSAAPEALVAGAKAILVKTYQGHFAPGPVT
jgi:hypothetical protein